MNGVTTQSPPPLPTEEQWARPNRQRILRSGAGELLVNEARSEEIAAALTPEDRRDLEISLVGARVELTPASAHEAFEDALVAELGKYLALTGGGWSAEDKAEWQNAAADELRDYPLSLLLPELRLARRREAWPNKLVPAIVEAIEPRVARLRTECATLEVLKEIADDRADVAA